MKNWINLIESARDDISAFADEFNDPRIVSRVQSQAARKNPKWMKTLIALMAKHSFKIVGSGINGAVFENPKYDYVLKVYRTDAAYDEWLSFVRSNRGNPYVPRIRGSVIRLNNVFKAIRLEPLKPSDVTRANEFTKQIDDLILKWDNIVQMRNVNRPLADVAQFMSDWEPVSDLTAHNIMERPNGDLVIVDPLYWEPGTDLDF